MIEATVRSFLLERFPEIQTALEKPPGPPETYILIEKTGGRNENRLRQATLAVQSIAPSLYEAAQLNEQVKAAMEELTELTNVFSCRCDSDYNFTDAESRERRYQAVFRITYKE